MKVAVYHCDICGMKTNDIYSDEITFSYGDTDPCWGSGNDDEEYKLLHDCDDEVYAENLRKLSDPNILVCWDCNSEGTPFDDAFMHVRKIRTKILLEMRNNGK